MDRLQMKLLVRGHGRTVEAPTQQKKGSRHRGRHTAEAETGVGGPPRVPRGDSHAQELGQEQIVPLSTQEPAGSTHGPRPLRTKGLLFELHPWLIRAALPQRPLAIAPAGGTMPLNTLPKGSYAGTVQSMAPGRGHKGAQRWPVNSRTPAHRAGEGDLAPAWGLTGHAARSGQGQGQGQGSPYVHLSFKWPWPSRWEVWGLEFKTWWWVGADLEVAGGAGPWVKGRKRTPKGVTEAGPSCTALRVQSEELRKEAQQDRSSQEVPHAWIRPPETSRGANGCSGHQAGSMCSTKQRAWWVPTAGAVGSWCKPQQPLGVRQPSAVQTGQAPPLLPTPDRLTPGLHSSSASSGSSSPSSWRVCNPGYDLGHGTEPPCRPLLHSHS